MAGDLGIVGVGVSLILSYHCTLSRPASIGTVDGLDKSEHHPFRDIEAGRHVDEGLLTGFPIEIRADFIMSIWCTSRLRPAAMASIVRSEANLATGAKVSL